MTWGAPSKAMLAEFEAKHGKVKRKVVKSKQRKPELTAEQAFAQAWESDPLPGAEMVPQHQFHPTRGWRFDFAWPQAMLALELNGWGTGGHSGRHHTYAGARDDCEKLTAAAALGWRVMFFMSGEKKRVADWLRTVKLALCGMEDT